MPTSTMARTKQTAGKSAGGKAPKKELAKKAALKAGKIGPRLHVYRHSLRSRRQISHFQRTTELLTSRVAWIRCIKSAMDELQTRPYKIPTWIKQGVVSIINESTKAFIIKIFTEAVEAMAHAKHVTITPNTYTWISVQQATRTMFYFDGNLWILVISERSARKFDYGWCSNLFEASSIFSTFLLVFAL